MLPYTRGTSHMSIRIWDVPYAYGPIYTYGAGHLYYGTCKCYVISTVTCYVLTTELWLPETFVITLFVKVVSELIQVILWLE